MKKILVVAYGASLSILIGLIAFTEKSNSTESDLVFKPVATLQELMVSVIDPNVDPIWNSVSTISTKEGTIEKKPQTDDEWRVLRNHVITLIEVSNLLVIDGRRVAAAGSSTSSHASELGPQEIEKMIKSNRHDFVKNAHALRDAAKRALAAIDQKNSDALVKTGGQIEHACEQCHSQFWYPNDKRPTAVLDLGLKSGSDLYMKMRKST